ncbi:MAG: hypothetical protein ABIP20_14995 [Chthoniobacteraceae bacterium]
MLLALLVGYADYVNGYDVSMAVFYAVPVIIAVWYGDRPSGLFMALFAVLVRFTADWANGHPYSSEGIRIWNITVAVAFLILIVVGFSAVRAQMNRSDVRISKLESTLPICSCCKKVEDENGSWSTLEDYIQEHLNAKPSTKLCRDCARKFYATNMGPGSGIR